MRDDNRIFLDTNILLAATDENRAGHDRIHDILMQAHRGEIHLYLNGQVLREYYVVATRPKEVNGFGLSPEEAISNGEFFRKLADYCEETEDVHRHLKMLIRTYSLSGKRIHDANIAAAMVSCNLKRILTFNGRDFSCFRELEILSP